MSEPTCIITGDVAGYFTACGDCDPCSAYARVSEPVRRLIANAHEWVAKYEGAVSRVEELEAALAERDRQIAALREALRKLANEASGLRADEWAIREAIGNTNWNVLMHHVAEARAALSAAQTGGDDAE